MAYDHRAIEARWQSYWKEHETFKAVRHAGRPKVYVLDMFPYPSGSGLHVGHPEGYTATDIFARYKRMRGFDVLHPMGWDAFGLPAEQHAISTGTHPRQTTRENIAHFREQLQSLGVSMLNVSAGSPYYVPHAQRPAAFPPSDGYEPPEDPLVGVARMLHAARAAQAAAAAMPVVSSGWSYLQEYLPHVAQACVRDGWFGGVGIGRMVLSYPELPADVLAGHALDTARLCRTFSDCTTAPRNGLVSGCYPLDHFYKTMPESDQLKALKRGEA